jgi:hypothetical protein
MLILEIVLAWCILSVPASLVVGTVLYRSGNAELMRPSWDQIPVRTASFPIQPVG